MTSIVRGQLYKLHDPMTAGTSSPLFRPLPSQTGKIDFSKLGPDGSPLAGNLSPTQRRSHTSMSKRRMSEIMLHIHNTGERLLGTHLSDWHLRPIEIDFKVAELRYVSHKQSDQLESRYAPGMKTIGFVQASTEVKEGPTVMTNDIDPITNNKLTLMTLEVTFFDLNTSFVGQRTFVFGHVEMEERDRWMSLIQNIAREKRLLEKGWEQYAMVRKAMEIEEMNDWEKAKMGEAQISVNTLARKKARLRNGKVFNDLDKTFESLANRRSTSGKELYMNGETMLVALEELGLSLHPSQTAALLEKLNNSPDPHLPRNFLDLDKFKEIFKQCYDDLTVTPSEQVKARLLQIMSKSKNAFLQMLSVDEQRLLIEGRGEGGRPNCLFKTFGKGAVLVSQGDEGDSMFIIVDGQLSVIVAFGSGENAQRKEVAVLQSGAVMGEMSLVLNKTRSATCAVKSETCSVAEIAKGAMTDLMKTRPYLQRELEEIVHRRDTANYLAANSAAAMAAYRKRGENKPKEEKSGGDKDKKEATTTSLPPVADGRTSSLDDSMEKHGKKSHADKRREEKARLRVKTRMTKKMRPDDHAARSSENNEDTGLPMINGAKTTVKTGRWVRCRDGYLLAFD